MDVAGFIFFIFMQDFNTEEFKETGVYEIVNTINGHSYIGSTKMSFQKRLNHHISLLRAGTHKNTYLQNAWNKYGEEAFSFNILKVVDSCCTLEEEQIFLDTQSPVYNINPLASGTPSMSPETIIKRSTSFKNTMQTAMAFLQKIKEGEIELNEVDPKYHKLITSRLNYIPWNKGLTSKDNDYSYLKGVKKKVKGDRSKDIETKKAKALPIFVYDLEFNLLGEFDWAQDVETFSKTDKNDLSDSFTL